jgi:hypothetical protein
MGVSTIQKRGIQTSNNGILINNAQVDGFNDSVYSQPYLGIMIPADMHVLQGRDVQVMTPLVV